MPQKTTTLPVEGDRNFVLLHKATAAAFGYTTYSAYVRDALESFRKQLITQAEDSVARHGSKDDQLLLITSMLNRTPEPA